MDYTGEDMNMVRDRKMKFTETHLIKLAYNSLLSIAFLHEANVMHRDLKPANMLINETFNVKICDFGLSRTVPDINMGLSGFNSMCLREEFLRQHENSPERLCVHEERNFISQ